jgi:hypothetical protein
MGRGISFTSSAVILIHIHIKRIIEKQSNEPLPQSTAKAARKYWQDYIKPGYTGPHDDDEMCELGYWIPVPGVSGIRNLELSEGHLYIDRYVGRISFTLSAGSNSNSDTETK